MRAPRLKHSVCKLTPEGWAYLVILCFIAAGAILRNVNLLIVTTGMLVVPILFNWRVCATLRGKLKGKRLLPDFVHAGQTANINWSCENNSKKLTAYNVMVHDLIADAAGAVVKPSVFQRVQSLVLKLVSSVFFRSVWPRTAAHACFVPVPANDVVWSSYRCHFPARGQHTFSHAVISVSWPFGLISCRTPVHEEDSVFVAPRLGYLGPAWEQKIDSFVAGDEARTRRVGVQDDHFYALRKWRSGDSRKHVHWRSMAKLGYPLVKQFDQPNNRDFALVLDLHEADESTRRRCETILSFAATAISRLSKESQEQIAIGIAATEQQLIFGAYTRQTYVEAMQCLAVATPVADPAIDSTIAKLAAKVSAGTPLYCVSSRPKPEWLVHPESEAEISPAEMAARNAVIWLEVNSPSFNRLFSMEEPRPQLQGEV